MALMNLGGKKNESVRTAWETEVGKRIAELDSGNAKTTSWEEVRRRNLTKLPYARNRCNSIRRAPLSSSQNASVHVSKSATVGMVSRRWK